jgi:AraC-like DNA-binding protein
MNNVEEVDERLVRKSRWLRVPQPQALAVSTLKRTTLPVTRLLSDTGTGVTDPHGNEDTFLVCVQLKDFANRGLWRDDRAVEDAPFSTGSVGIFDLSRNWVSDCSDPFDVVHIHVTLDALRAAGEENETRPASVLRASHSERPPDERLLSLVRSLLPSLAEPEEANALFVSHVTTAINLHLATTYGDMIAVPPRLAGGLSRAQTARILELLDANLDGNVSLSELAAECGLSVSRFARSFRRSTGVTATAWLQERRLARAQDLMRATRMPLVEVANACGFADQSHFTRVFTQRFGRPPARWRTAIRGLDSRP